jgi:hypothetical protein
MKKGKILIVWMLLGLALSGCASGGTVPPQATAYLPPGSSQETSNPSISNPSVMYPQLQDGDNISWGQLVAMITNGEVEKIATGDGSQLTLSLKDGRSFKVVQLVAGMLDEVLKQCGDKCKDIQVSN